MLVQWLDQCHKSPNIVRATHMDHLHVHTTQKLYIY